MSLGYPGPSRSQTEFPRSYKDLRKPSDYVKAIQGIYGALTRVESLKPSPTVNSLFHRLVGVCLNFPGRAESEEILNNAFIYSFTPKIRELCSKAEYELELHWATEISKCTSEKNALDKLRQFPYYENFLDLTNMEIHALNSIFPNPSIYDPLEKPPWNIAFIGSGPLPLSSICMLDVLSPSFDDENSDPGGQSTNKFAKHKQPSEKSLSKRPATIKITNIDRCPIAIEISQRFCNLVPRYADGLRFMQADATSLELSLRDYDVVFLAALVGDSEVEKEKMMEKVARKMKSHALLVVRSAHGLRTLLYPPVHVHNTMGGGRLEPLLVVNPCGKVVNSMVIARVK